MIYAQSLIRPLPKTGMTLEFAHDPPHTPMEIAVLFLAAVYAVVYFGGEQLVQVLLMLVWGGMALFAIVPSIYYTLLYLGRLLFT